MSEKIPFESKPDVSSSVEDIYSRGDNIDRERRFTRYHGAITFGGSVAVASIPALSTEVILNAKWLGSAPVYELAAAAIATGAYKIATANDKKAVVAAEQEQAVIREALGEPVDLLRNGTKSKKRKDRATRLIMHWHGANSLGNDVDIDNLTERLAKIVQFNEENGITDVMMGADWLKDIIGKEARETEWGNIVEGQSAVSNYKWLSKGRIKVSDLEADEHVLVATNQQARKLIQKIEIGKVELTIKRLMGYVTNETVQRAHASFVDGKLQPEKFREIVRFALEREYDRHITPGHQKEADQYGALTIRQRVNSQISISNDGHFYEKTQWNDHYSGQARMGIEGQASLLRSHGVDNIEALITKIMMSKNHDERASLSALYLTLIKEHYQAVPGPQTDQQPRTLFQRMSKERLVTLPHLDSLPPADDDGPTVEYKHTRSKPDRRAIGAAIMFVSGMVGLGVGGVANAADSVIERSVIKQHDMAQEAAKENPAYINEAGVFNKEKFEADYKAALEASGSSFDREYLKTYDDIRKFNDNLAQYMLDKYTYALGSTLGSFSDKLDLKMLNDWKRKHLQSSPSTASARNSGETGIGDVNVGNGETNSTIFSIKSLNGRSTEGYWYTDLMTNMDVSSGQLRYTRTAPDGPKLEVSRDIYSITDSEIAKSSPDFMIETDYLFEGNGDKQPIALPKMQGDIIVGARVIDGKDPTKMINLMVENIKGGGSQAIVDDEMIERMRDAGIDQPKLQYWLKHTGETTIDNRYGLSYPKGIDFGRIREETKAALGLSWYAPDDEVIAKIRESKYYSFAPLKDAQETLPSGDDPQQLLREMGTTLAKIDSLNCNLASTLALLSTEPVGVMYPTNNPSDPREKTTLSGLNLGTGFHDDGDGKLTQLEGHDWLVGNEEEIIDPTPSKFKNGAPDMSPRSPKPAESKMPERLPFDAKNVPAALLAATLAVVAWRRREQIQQSWDEDRAQSVSRSKSAPEALSTIMTAIYGAPGSKMVKIDPNMSPAEIRQKVHSSIPEDGISLREVKDRLAEKGHMQKIPLRTQMAIMALGQYDRSIRRSTKRR